jgi:heme/copper-type cytochrome/quinol oxidase subunit 4
MSPKTSVSIVLGIVIVAIAAAVLYSVLGADHLATGTVAGIGIAYLGFLLYFFLMPRPDKEGFSFFKSYLPGAVIRYVVMIGVFCAVIFLLDMKPLGVLLGTFIGMMISTFVSLNGMRKANKPPEA